MKHTLSENFQMTLYIIFIFDSQFSFTHNVIFLTVALLTFKQYQPLSANKSVLKFKIPKQGSVILQFIIHGQQNQLL